MRKKIMIAAFVLSIVAVSCSNDNETTPTPDPIATKLLTSVTDNFTPPHVYSTIAYNADLSFKSYTDYERGKKAEEPLVTTLKYDNGKPVAILTGIKTDGSDATTLYELQSNPAGQIVKVIQKKDAFSNMKYDTLLYNEAGDLTEIRHYGENGIDDTEWLTGIEKFTWENKNLVKVEEEFWQLGVLLSQNYVTNYTYDKKINPFRNIPQIVSLYSQMQNGTSLYNKSYYYSYLSQNNPLVLEVTASVWQNGTGMVSSTETQSNLYTYSEDGYPIDLHYQIKPMGSTNSSEIKIQKFLYN